MNDVQIPRWFALFAVVMAAGTLALSAVGDALDHLTPDTEPDPETAGQVAEAVEQLDQLEVAPETSHSTYERDQFGGGWAAQSGRWCDTRQQVLAEETTSDPEADGCQVTGGRWESWFDGQTHTDPAGLDIDHLVPLAEAWASGANTWDPARREAFANDLDRPDALVAVTAEVNRAKGDQDPAEWLPPATAGRCRYAAGWVTQKHAWDLTVDQAEHDALTDVLDNCTTEGGGL